MPASMISGLAGRVATCLLPRCPSQQTAVATHMLAGLATCQTTWACPSSAAPALPAWQDVQQRQQPASTSGRPSLEAPHHCSSGLLGSHWSWRSQQNLPTVCRGFAATPAVDVEAAIDAFGLVKQEIESISERLRRSIICDIPSLERAAEYFFQLGAEGKRLRPTMLLLLASSLSATAPSAAMLTVDETPHSSHPTDTRRRQQRIAEITEMIHVASLLHDDVIDSAETRRGLKALNSVMGNKVAILAGDFLLARASMSLAALHNTEVIVLLSQVIEHLVSGEILQLTATPEQALSVDHYINKTFYKTASLMANSCKAVAVLGGHGPSVCQAAWEYGRHLGLAFQFVDDMLDFTSTSQQLGKPALNDLKSGVVTAPALFALAEHPELEPLIRRNFRGEGDVERATEMIYDSQGLQRTRDLAAEHCRLAVNMVSSLPSSQHKYAELCRQGLNDIAARVLNRTK